MRNKTRAFSVAIAGIVAFNGISASASLAECVMKAPRPVHRTYIQRDVVEPGVYEVQRRPSLYGWTSDGRRILLRPYKNVTNFQRPYIAWYREHLTIQPEPEVYPAEPDC
jgi:hypothetical protein